MNVTSLEIWLLLEKCASPATTYTTGQSLTTFAFYLLWWRCCHWGYQRPSALQCHPGEGCCHGKYCPLYLNSFSSHSDGVPNFPIRETGPPQIISPMGSCPVLHSLGSLFSWSWPVGVGQAHWLLWICSPHWCSFWPLSNALVSRNFLGVVV